MSWRDQLQPAEFRKVPFFVKSAEGIAGRRTARHDYPQRDDAYVEDMGRKAREFTLDAFIIGANYMQGRDALLNAVEQHGPGLLIHPYRGRFNVVVTECRYTETSERGGMVTFSLTFVESFENTEPTTKVDTQAKVGIAADAAKVAAENNFASKFKTAGFSSFVGTAALAKINGVLNSVRGAILNGFADLNFLPGFISELTSLQGEIGLLLALPGNLGKRLADQLNTLLELFSPSDAYATATAMGNIEPDIAVPAITPSSTQQGENQDAINELMESAALIGASRASSQMEFASLDEAQQVMGELVTWLDRVMLTAPDDVYDAFATLRTAVVQDISARGADLSKVKTYTSRATLPALVVAHQLYGDATRADEIVARNRIRHPGFVPGGVALEVLA